MLIIYFSVVRNLGSFGAEVLRWWDVLFCIPNNMSDWFSHWGKICPNTNAEKGWKILFYVVIWSTFWTTPPAGSINVDRSAIGKTRSGRCHVGGVIRNLEGYVLGLFYKHIGTSDSNFAEFCAIREALTILAPSELKETYWLII